MHVDPSYKSKDLRNVDPPSSVRDKLCFPKSEVGGPHIHPASHFPQSQAVALGSHNREVIVLHFWARSDVLTSIFLQGQFELCQHLDHNELHIVDREKATRTGLVAQAEAQRINGGHAHDHGALSLLVLVAHAAVAMRVKGVGLRKYGRVRGDSSGRPAGHASWRERGRAALECVRLREDSIHSHCQTLVSGWSMDRNRREPYAETRASNADFL